MTYFLAPGIESLTLFTDADDNGNNFTYHIAIIHFSDGRVKIEDSVREIEFFATAYTEIPGGGFVAKNDDHEFILQNAQDSNS